VHRLRIAVLRVLNEKHHQKSNDGGARIDNELPGIGKMKDRTGAGPDNDNENRDRERPGTPENVGCLSGKDMKGLLKTAEKIVFFFRGRMILIGVCDSKLASSFPTELRA